jgi:2'-5' RNA ligase
MPEGLGSPDLECVMLALEPLQVVSLVPDAHEGELFYGTTPELKYAQGAVGEDKAHVTLLFGIHPSPSYRRNVNAVLGTWKPAPIHIESVSTFPIRDEEQEYYVVKGDVMLTANLLEGRARITTLDHTDIFPVYHPHVTLAYVKRTADVDRWVNALNKAYAGKTFAVTGIDYGDDH